LNSHFTKFPSIVFTFCNGVRPNPDFSGNVIARLYVDNDQNFCLAIWPNKTTEKVKPMIKEILLENVEKVSFEFYRPDIQGVKQENPGWQNDWLKDQKLPGMLRINLNLPKEDREERKELNFLFHLPKQAKDKDVIFFHIKS